MWLPVWRVKIRAANGYCMVGEDCRTKCIEWRTLVQSLPLVCSVLIYHELGGIQSDWPCRQRHRSDSEHKDMLLPFPACTHTSLTGWKVLLWQLCCLFFLNACVCSFLWWCSRSCCPEVILSDSTVFMGCCVRDSASSYMIQSCFSSSFFG